MKVIELFAGIGACSTALKRIGIDVEIVDAVEIDKYAIASFNAIHNTNFETQDIRLWDKKLKDIDLIMHGSPCQDFSLAGKQAGGDKGSGTRSSLMYETIRIVKKIKPKYVVWENVKNILSKKHIHNFESYLRSMEELGYSNYYQVLNAKDYGIPQNRERVFTVSILGNSKYKFPQGDKCENKVQVVGNYMPSNHDASRIVDENGLAPTIKENHGTVTAVIQGFEFPIKQELKLKLKDMLEDKVEEKYYLSEKMMNYILDNNNTQKGTKWEGRANNDVLNSTVAHALGARSAGGSQRAGVSNFIVDNVQGEIQVKDLKKEHYQKNGNKMKLKEQLCNYLVENNLVKENDVIRHSYSTSRMKNMYTQNRKNNNTAPTLDTRCDCLGVAVKSEELRIRKLTPKECWRLMGFTDEDFQKAAKVNSNSQLYKQAGNSIVVNVLEKIFINLLNMKY